MNSGPPLEQKSLEPLAPHAFHRTFQTSLRKALMFYYACFTGSKLFSNSGRTQQFPSTIPKEKRTIKPTNTYYEKTFVVQLFDFHKTHNSKKMRIDVFI
jgi:hypothetical protein